MFCPKCGTDIENAKFCYKCGAPQPKQLTDKSAADIVRAAHPTAELNAEENTEDIQDNITDAPALQLHKRKHIIFLLMISLVLVTATVCILLFPPRSHSPLTSLTQALAKTLESGNFEMQQSINGSHSTYTTFFKPNRYAFAVSQDSPDWTWLANAKYTARITNPFGEWSVDEVMELTETDAEYELFNSIYWGIASGDSSNFLAKADNAANESPAFILPKYFDGLIRKVSSDMQDEIYLKDELGFQYISRDDTQKWTFSIRSSSAFWRPFEQIESSRSSYMLSRTMENFPSPGTVNLTFTAEDGYLSEIYCLMQNEQGAKGGEVSIAFSKFGESTLTVPENIDELLSAAYAVSTSAPAALESMAPQEVPSNEIEPPVAITPEPATSLSPEIHQKLDSGMYRFMFRRLLPGYVQESDYLDTTLVACTLDYSDIIQLKDYDLQGLPDYGYHNMRASSYLQYWNGNIITVQGNVNDGTSELLRFMPNGEKCTYGISCTGIIGISPDSVYIYSRTSGSETITVSAVREYLTDNYYTEELYTGTNVHNLHTVNPNSQSLNTVNSEWNNGPFVPLGDWIYFAENYDSDKRGAVLTRIPMSGGGAETVKIPTHLSYSGEGDGLFIPDNYVMAMYPYDPERLLIHSPGTSKGAAFLFAPARNEVTILCAESYGIEASANGYFFHTHRGDGDTVDLYRRPTDGSGNCALVIEDLPLTEDSRLVAYGDWLFYVCNVFNDSTKEREFKLYSIANASASPYIESHRTESHPYLTVSNGTLYANLDGEILYANHEYGTLNYDSGVRLGDKEFVGFKESGKSVYLLARDSADKATQPPYAGNYSVVEIPTTFTRGAPTDIIYPE